MPLYNVMGNPGDTAPTEGAPASNLDLLNKNFRSRIASRDAKTGAMQERTNMNPDLQFLSVKDSIMAMLGTGANAQNQTFKKYAYDLKEKLGDENAMRVIESITSYNAQTQGVPAKERITSWMKNSINQKDYVGKLSQVLNNAYSDYGVDSSQNADVQSLIGAAPQSAPQQQLPRLATAIR